MPLMLKVFPTDAPKFLRDYATQGYDVVLGYSGGFVNAVQQVAPEFLTQLLWQLLIAL